jgi:hypothetical protein
MRPIIIALLAVALLIGVALWPRRSPRPTGADRDDPLASSLPVRAAAPRPSSKVPGECGRVHQPPLKLAPPLDLGTNKIVALNYAGGDNTAGACRIEDVMKKLNIRFG